MADLTKMTREQLEARLGALEAAYDDYKARNLTLDMSRGKPGPEQLELTMELLNNVNKESGAVTASGTDARNYGVLEGIPECRQMFAELFQVDASQVIVGGNSSLNMMFDYIAQAYSHGVCGGSPWCREEKVKFLCPAPGYDRHFAVTEYFGFELITVDMTENGPDMDQVERLAADPSVKGIWCVPMYSNPDGITYSDETVRRLAAMETGAPDFRIMWDNAYGLHHLTDTPDSLLDIYREAEARGHEDRVVMFMSTSKISFPGAGVAALASSPANIADIRRRLSFQTIGYDKINMLRHARFFGDAEGLRRHYSRHAEIIRPKFQAVLEALELHLGGKGIARWKKPHGGYFVSIFLLDGCAKETIRLLKEAGVMMTSAGATYPYGRDPHDSNIRIAPTYPSLEEIRTASDLFCICAELACTRKLLEK